jgi:hypothetical protein
MTVEDFIRQKFSVPEIGEYYAKLWLDFSASRLADTIFSSEIANGDEGKFWQRIWEALLARLLMQQGHKLSSADEGPDFCLDYDGKKVWVEAMVPEPTGIPIEWAGPPKHNEVTTVPFDEILLRWTSALKEKYEKLEGRTQNGRMQPGFLEKGIVSKDDVYVVAINPCRLSSRPWIDEGTSRLPFAVEAVFPVGPWAIPIDEDNQLGKAVSTQRFSIRNKNSSEVSTYSFLNPGYSNVSALIGCSPRKPTSIFPSDDVKLIVVHNPLAKNRLPPGLFRTNAIEYFAEPIGEKEYEIKMTS